MTSASGRDPSGGDTAGSKASAQTGGEMVVSGDPLAVRRTRSRRIDREASTATRMSARAPLIRPSLWTALLLLASGMCIYMMAQEGGGLDSCDLPEVHDLRIKALMILFLLGALPAILLWRDLRQRLLFSAVDSRLALIPLSAWGIGVGTLVLAEFQLSSLAASACAQNLPNVPADFLALGLKGMAAMALLVVLGGTAWIMRHAIRS